MVRERMNKRYEQEKQIHINQGAELDGDNGSIIRKSRKEDKLAAQSREGNIALEVDRPVLPVLKFDELKSDLLSKVEANYQPKKPELKFLDINSDEADD